MKKQFSEKMDTRGLIQKHINFWFNEFPFTIDKTTEILSKKITPINKNLKLNSKKICIEFFLPRHTTNYALLGLEYETIENDYLEISVTIPKTTEKYSTEIECIDSDKKYKGILSEYKEAIFKEAIETLNSLNVGFTGKLNFNFGAYCEVGSSIKAFQIATKMLINLLIIDNYSNDNLQEIFKKFI